MNNCNNSCWIDFFTCYDIIFETLGSQTHLSGEQAEDAHRFRKRKGQIPDKNKG